MDCAFKVSLKLIIPVQIEGDFLLLTGCPGCEIDYLLPLLTVVRATGG